MACSKLEAMAVYVVKEVCGNEIMPSVYIFGGGDSAICVSNMKVNFFYSFFFFFAHISTPITKNTSYTFNGGNPW